MRKTQSFYSFLRELFTQTEVLFRYSFISPENSIIMAQHFNDLCNTMRFLRGADF